MQCYTSFHFEYDWTVVDLPHNFIKSAAGCGYTRGDITEKTAIASHFMDNFLFHLVGQKNQKKETSPFNWLVDDNEKK